MDKKLCGALLLYQRGLAGRTQPGAAVFDPGVGESAVMVIRFAFQRSLFVIYAGHDDSVSMNVAEHGFAADAVNVLGAIGDACEKLSLVLKAAVNVHKDECLLAKSFIGPHGRRIWAGVYIYNELLPVDSCARAVPLPGNEALILSIT